MNQKVLVFIGFMALSLAMLAVAVVLPYNIFLIIPKFIFLILAVIFDVMAFSSRYYTYLLLPFVRQRRKDVVINDQTPYWLASGGECIIRKIDNYFVATAYINIPLYVSASEMSDEEKLRFSMQLSKLIGISKDPVRFTSELYLMNKDTYILRLKDTITSIENEEATLKERGATEGEMEHVRGKLSMWKKMLDNIATSPSYELGTFAAISAFGYKEYEAITNVQVRARELMNGIASSMGVPPSIVTGSEILKYVEPEYLIPFSTAEEEINRRVAQV